MDWEVHSKIMMAFKLQTLKQKEDQGGIEWEEHAPKISKSRHAQLT